MAILPCKIVTTSILLKAPTNVTTMINRSQFISTKYMKTYNKEVVSKMLRKIFEKDLLHGELYESFIAKKGINTCTSVTHSFQFNLTCDVAT